MVKKSAIRLASRQAQGHEFIERLMALREIEGLSINPCLPAGRLSLRPELRPRGIPQALVREAFQQAQSR